MVFPDIHYDNFSVKLKISHPFVRAKESAVGYISESNKLENYLFFKYFVQYQTLHGFSLFFIQCPSKILYHHLIHVRLAPGREKTILYEVPRDE